MQHFHLCVIHFYAYESESKYNRDEVRDKRISMPKSLKTFQFISPRLQSHKYQRSVLQQLFPKEQFSLLHALV
jgi:hypothetical protein